MTPWPPRRRTPGFAATAAVSLVERLGCRDRHLRGVPRRTLVMTVDGTDVDLVVLVLDGAWVGRCPSWADGAWGLPARLTSAYVDKGIPVLAVGAGAGAGALAACVAQGALALFGLDRLADALRSLERSSVEEARQVAELEFPERFRALLGLTAGERRVLFYLTQGWTAQDIADELVVSLTTVRSHIRSVLRKLGVRSQLAAVAVATSRDLEHHDLSDADEGVRTAGRGTTPPRPTGRGARTRAPAASGGARSARGSASDRPPVTLARWTSRGSSRRAPELGQPVGVGLGDEHGRAGGHPVGRLGHVERGGEGVQLAEQVPGRHLVEEGVEPVDGRSPVPARRPGPGCPGGSPATR